MKKSVMCAALTMAFGVSAAQAVTITGSTNTAGNNFTMVSASNGLTGGTNDVTFVWDGTYKNAVVTDGSSNASVSSPTAFSGGKWTAHHMNVYGPGTYTFYVGCVSGGVASLTYNPSCGAGATYVMTVPTGKVGAHMLFNWKTNTDIDVVLLWDMNKSWAQTGTVSAFNAGAGNTIDTVWGGVSIDTDMDPDTYSGTKMIDGPFVGQSANFNVLGMAATVPVYTVTAAGGVTIPSSSFLSASAAATIAAAHTVTPPTGITFNSGFAKYTLGNLVGGAGGKATVTIAFPETITGKDIYYFKESTGVYTKLSAGVLDNQYQLVNPTTISITVTDGGPLDDDGLAANNSITDPIGLGTPVVAAAEATLGVSGGGGGCTVDSSGKDISMLVALLASLGYVGWKRRRS